MRQVLVGAGSYHLIDDNLDPLPVRLSSLMALVTGAQCDGATIQLVESIHVIYLLINGSLLTSDFEKI